MKARLDDRIARAGELSKTYPSASSLLSFYRELALFQKTVAPVSDVRALAHHFPALIDLVRRIGPAPLSAFNGPLTPEDMLQAYWEGQPPNDPVVRFYAQVLLQPFAEYLASRTEIQSDLANATCPFCGARPVVAVLRGEGDGGKRSLLCSLCATEWLYRRVICPGCGEENKDKLPIYIAADFEHVRVDACDTCQTYIKSVDLTKDGHAVPAVDELATVALNIWAEEHGYSKLEPNLLGM
jgi:FdhE protein